MTASDSSAAVEAAANSELDERHYLEWADARASAIDRARSHVESQLGSLTTTYHARVQLLEEQIATASHDNIRRMRESELRSVEDDYTTRSKQLAATIARSDVTTTLLCAGIVKVVDG